MRTGQPESHSARLRVETLPGFPDAIDTVAECALPHHRFLRSAWFRAAAPSGGATVVARRADGTAITAIATFPVGPSLLGARAVPGSYWPYRGIPISTIATDVEITAMLADADMRRALGPVWRLGPIYADRCVGGRLAASARRAGWTVLKRGLGTSFVLDIAGARAAGAWPRKSTLRKIRYFERQLGERGTLSFQFVRGADWNDKTFEALATVEANSWIARRTDGSGAKFLSMGQRAHWQRAVRDPALAEMLSAALLRVDGVPVAFCFDLNVGSTQYGIASSYDERFAAQRVGKIITYRSLQESAARGIGLVDLGAGDSGYKREIGAEAGPPIVDLLFVQNRALAALLRPLWQRAAVTEPGTDAPDRAKSRPEWRGFEPALLAALTTAAAAIAASE